MPGSWGGGWGGDNRWGESWGGGKQQWNESPGKGKQDSRTWDEKYTYLNGPHRQSHTVPVEDRISLVRTVVIRSQEGEATALKLPVVRTLSWPADMVDTVLYLFVVWKPLNFELTVFGFSPCQPIYPSYTLISGP